MGRWRGARRPRRAAHRHWTCVSTAAGVCVLVCCCEGVRIGVGVLGVPAVARGAARHRARARTSRLRVEKRLIAFKTRIVAVLSAAFALQRQMSPLERDERRSFGVKGVWTLNALRCLKDELGRNPTRPSRKMKPLLRPITRERRRVEHSSRAALRTHLPVAAGRGDASRGQDPDHKKTLRAPAPPPPAAPRPRRRARAPRPWPRALSLRA